MQPWFHKISAREDEIFRARYRGQASALTARLPESFQNYVMDGWDARYGIPFSDANRSPVKLANVFAVQSVEAFGGARVASAYDEGRIRDYAENYSRLCALMGTLEQRREFGLHIGIEPPQGKDITDAGEIARWCDPMWWRRQLRKVWTRAAEDAMRAAGIIRKGRSPYASDEAVEHRRRRVRRMAEWLKSRVMVAEQTGETIDLEEIMAKSIANPALRNKEFMTRSRGFTEMARDLGHVGIAATLTTPSYFHAQLSRGGVNPRWEADRARVRDGQQWLCQMWARVRAKFKRKGIHPYGFRCAEPHHDGTPHWHAMMYVPPEQAAMARKILRVYWLRKDQRFRYEPGAKEYRIKLKELDPARGGMAAYMAKYFAKNLDATSMADEQDHETGGAVGDSLQRVVAWASTHGIRQFQQIGGPPVGVWRELRRVRDELQGAEAIEAARLRADGADWRGFIGTMGGMERCARRVVCITGKWKRTMRKVPRFPIGRERVGTKYYGMRKDGTGPLQRGIYKMRYRDARPDEMPAVWLDRSAPIVTDPQGREVLMATRYGETPDERTSGLCSYGLMGRYNSANTRKFRWRIEKKCTPSVSVGCDTPRSTLSCAKRLHSDLQSASMYSGSGLSRSMSGECSKSHSLIGSDSRSDLGPVAITVRNAEAEAREVERAKLALADAIAGKEWREWVHRPSTWKERPPNAGQLERIMNKAAGISRRAGKLYREENDYRRASWLLIHGTHKRH